MRAILRKLLRPLVGPQLDQLARIETELLVTRDAVTALRGSLDATNATIAKLDGQLDALQQAADRNRVEALGRVQFEHAERLLHGAMARDLGLLRRELSLVARNLTLPAPDQWQDGIRTPPAEAPARGVLQNSILCRQEEMETGWYTFWARRMGLEPRYHRKHWEFVFIAQALYERDLLREGRTGLGFGVGKEPLAALFASYGAEVIGTDMAFDAAVEAGWATHNQHAAGKEQLRDSRICPDALFDAKVRFETFDMTATPGHFRDLDFCWSSCAFEHLGTIEAGLSFVERSLDCLKPGGVAVHTTEYNLTSNRETVEQGETVLFRRRDFEALVERLEKAGHHVAPLDLREGNQPNERYVDMPPYRDEPHLRLALQGYATTSIGLIVTRK